MINRYDADYIEGLKNKDISEFTEDEMILWQNDICRNHYNDSDNKREKRLED